jgi:hypothetical protein
MSVGGDVRSRQRSDGLRYLPWFNPPFARQEGRDYRTFKPRSIVRPNSQSQRRKRTKTVVVWDDL